MCECQADLGEGQKVLASELLSMIKSQEFQSSSDIYRLNKSEQITEPTLHSMARYDPKTDQAIVVLNCQGDKFLYC